MTTVTITYIDRPITETVEVDNVDFVSTGLILTIGARRTLIPANRLVSATWQASSAAA
jgi:hypothetical protein